MAQSRSGLGGKLCGHQRMAPYFNGAPGLDVEFQTADREFHAGDIEVIFTPGHTDNNVCYRYISPHGKTYLFTGDAIYQSHGEWRTLIFTRDGGNAGDLKRSLLRLRQLEVDVLICSVSTGDVQIVEVAQAEWHGIIDRLLTDLSGPT